jgi:hypothetical protein
VLGCVGMATFFVISLSDILCELLNHMVQKGSFCVGNLSTASGNHLSKTVAKHDILL